MELAMQIISNDKTVWSNTVNDLKEFNNQSLATQAKKREQLVSMMLAIKKFFWFDGWWYSWFIYRKRCFEKQNWFLRWKMVGGI